MKWQSVRMTHVDGRMHHLGVDESHIAKDVILTPDPMLVPFYAQFMENAVEMGDYREYVTYTGTYNGKPLTVMSCGFGCMPMAIAVEELNHLGAERVIRVGTNAAIQEEIVPGSFCLASAAVRGEGATLEYIDASYPAVADMDLLSKLLESEAGSEMRVGIFRSHDVENHETPYVPGGMDRIKYWSGLGVDLLDGETSAMYVIGQILGVKTASVSLVTENHLSGEMLDDAAQKAGMERMFRAAAEALA
ncbi:MAG: nucleoside phosphorylase [Oscillospiraceae bacterium]|nr:nucleoside phosphorylase [Oscillospiraceae bacterium]